MKSLLILTLAFCFISSLWAGDVHVHIHSNNDELNLFPVIGILALPSKFPEYPAKNWTFMAASYVKYIESAGARVVPVPWDLPSENLTSLLKSLNGFLFTGGSTSFVDPKNNASLTTYGQAVQNIINSIIKFNQEGTYYPLWGTCLGFQEISCVIAGQASGNYHCLHHIDGFAKVRKNIGFFESGLNHNMFTKLAQNVHQSLLKDSISFFSCNNTVQLELWDSNPGLKGNFTPLAYAIDNDGNKVPVIIAGTKYPIYGSQFHPEKLQFEWNEVEDIPHSYEAILSAQMYANFFVNEARKNRNTFNNSGIDLDAIVIYNYNPIEIPGTLWEQVYLFEKPHTNATHSQATPVQVQQSIDEKMVIGFLQP